MTVVQTPRRSRGVVLAGAMALVLAVAACDGDDASSSSSSTSGGSSASTPTEQTLEGVRATVVQQRIDEGTRRIGIEVSTDSATSVDVVGWQLRSPGFRAVPPERDETSFAPGQTTDLITEYGAPQCNVADPTADLQALLEVKNASGATELFAVPVTGTGVGLVRRLHTRECEELRLRRAAQVSYSRFSRARVDGNLVLTGALVFERPAHGSGEPVTVESILGSVLFDLKPLTPGKARFVARLDPAATRLRLPVSIGSSGRCDQHSRSQSTQTFLFNVYVRVDDAPEHRVIAVPPAGLQRQALALLDDIC